MAELTELEAAAVRRVSVSTAALHVVNMAFDRYPGEEFDDAAHCEGDARPVRVPQVEQMGGKETLGGASGSEEDKEGEGKQWRPRWRGRWDRRQDMLTWDEIQYDDDPGNQGEEEKKMQGGAGGGASVDTSGASARAAGVGGRPGSLGGDSASSRRNMYERPMLDIVPPPAGRPPPATISSSTAGLIDSARRQARASRAPPPTNVYGMLGRGSRGSVQLGSFRGETVAVRTFCKRSDENHPTEAAAWTEEEKGLMLRTIADSVAQTIPGLIGIKAFELCDGVLAGDDSAGGSSGGGTVVSRALGRIVMEIAPQGSLAALMARVPPHPETDPGCDRFVVPHCLVAAWVRDLANALACMHARDWVHGDVSPSTILVTAGPRLKFASLGRVRQWPDVDCIWERVVADPLGVKPQIVVQDDDSHPAVTAARQSCTTPAGAELCLKVKGGASGGRGRGRGRGDDGDAAGDAAEEPAEVGMRAQKKGKRVYGKKVAAADSGAKNATAVLAAAESVCGSNPAPTPEEDVYAVGRIMLLLMEGCLEDAGDRQGTEKEGERILLPDHAPMPLEVALRQCLLRDPGSRPSARELARKMTAFLDSYGGDARFDPRLADYIPIWQFEDQYIHRRARPLSRRRDIRVQHPCYVDPVTGNQIQAGQSAENADRVAWHEWMLLNTSVVRVRSMGMVELFMWNGIDTPWKLGKRFARRRRLFKNLHFTPSEESDLRTALKRDDLVNMLVSERLAIDRHMAAADNMDMQEKERVALYELYQATNGPSWHRRQNWCTDKPVDTWFGIDTDDDGRVTEISLYGNNLVGSLPDSIGAFTALKQMRLQQNQISNLPRPMVSLIKLSVLDVSYNPPLKEFPNYIMSLPKLNFLSVSQSTKLSKEAEDICRVTGVTLRRRS